MRSLREIIEQHTVSELADIIFKELSVYHTTKISKAIQQADRKISTFDYEEKTERKPLDTVLHADIDKDKLREILNKESNKDKTFVNGYANSNSYASFYGSEVQRAKEIVQKEIDTWHKVDCFVTFGVNALERTVEVKVFKENDPRNVYAEGKAHCNSSDIFYESIGKLIALYKANYPDMWKDKLHSIGFGYLFEK